MSSSWGKPWTDDKYNHLQRLQNREYGLPAQVAQAPTDHPSPPMMTATSVIAVKFNGGVMMAADTLVSMNSMARFTDVQRVHSVGENTILGWTGGYNDWQFMQKQLEGVMLHEDEEDDGHSLNCKEIYDYLSLVMYSRRSEIKPLWNSYVIGGIDPKTDKPFLGYVDKVGTTYTSDSIGTGFGSHFAQPLMRKALEGRGDDNLLSEQEAATLLRTCMRVLFLRDGRSLNKYQLGVVTKEGVRLSEPESLEIDWSAFVTT